MILQDYLNAIKEETTANSIKDRLSWKTLSNTAKTIRNASGFISGVLFAVSKIPLNLPENIIDWLEWGTYISLAIAGGSHMNKSGKK